ncbi:putative peroxisome organization [Lyophyllum shimeji]|uniref:Peroxisome organization n=1 Tax=Lyophyllum shimeji TaxID=47721 RepID=A0A9P3UKE1_LYOSH|nr:putative peroxisome organization [Lyophyllum shimeji]
MDLGLEAPGNNGACSPADAPSTPPEGIHFTPRRAMASFDNLVALANHQERLREARKMVWRDRGEPVFELTTLRECLEHAAAGGFRSGTLALSIRACVNLILALIRIHKVPRDIRFAIVRQAVFGQDTLRFGLMLGTFTSVYKFLLNALPILIPALNPPKVEPRMISNGTSSDSPFFDDLEKGPTAEHPSTPLHVPLARRTARLSLSTSAQLLLIRKRTRRWHAALAGAIAGGLAIMWEKRSRRSVIAQQMFVRGLQGSYNAYTTKRNIRVPNGDVLVFALACGQIMYGFLLRPDTLPRSYHSWIGQAAKVPEECVRMNLGLVREGKFDVADLDRLTSRSDITPSNAKDLLNLRSLFLSPPDPKTLTDPLYLPHYAPCSAVHPALTSCSSVPLDRFFAVFKWMLPIYGALHFVPAVLFKRKAFMQDPGKMLVRASLGSMRSSAFLGVFVVIYQTLYCYKHKLHKYLTLLKLTKSVNPLRAVPQAFIDALISKASFWLPGFLAGLSLFVEEKRRRGELAMYVLPKGLESAWIMARGKGWVFRTGNLGEMWLTALGMAMVMSTYQNDPQHLSGLVRRILYQFIGPN